MLISELNAMEEHHPSLKAINLIKESELAYLEVYEK